MSIPGERKYLCISADIQRITLNASSCIMISGGRTEQLDITVGFLLHHSVTSFTSDFLSFIVVEQLEFSHRARQMLGFFCDQLSCCLHKCSKFDMICFTGYRVIAE